MDAEFVHNLVTEFRSTSEATRVSDMSNKSNNVLEEALKSKESAITLKDEISKFTI